MHLGVLDFFELLHFQDGLLEVLSPEPGDYSVGDFLVQTDLDDFLLHAEDGVVWFQDQE